MGKDDWQRLTLFWLDGRHRGKGIIFLDVPRICLLTTKGVFESGRLRGSVCDVIKLAGVVSHEWQMKYALV